MVYRRVYWILPGALLLLALGLRMAATARGSGLTVRLLAPADWGMSVDRCTVISDYDNGTATKRNCWCGLTVGPLQGENERACEPR
jgi:hypothetical protein